MEESTKEFFHKWRVPLVCVLIGLLLVLSVGAGYAYGKNKICRDSGGVLAIVPGQGEKCVQNFIDAQNCKGVLAPADLVLTAHFCRDSTGLYPLGVVEP